MIGFTSIFFTYLCILVDWLVVWSDLMVLVEMLMMIYADGWAVRLYFLFGDFMALLF